MSCFCILTWFGLRSIKLDISIIQNYFFCCLSHYLFLSTVCLLAMAALRSLFIQESNSRLYVTHEILGPKQRQTLKVTETAAPFMWSCSPREIHSILKGEKLASTSLSQTGTEPWQASTLRAILYCPSCDVRGEELKAACSNRDKESQESQKFWVRGCV